MTKGCATPLDDATVLGWWTGELAAAEEERVEEHLFACGECRYAAGTLAALAEGVKKLVRSGRPSGVLLRPAVERLEQEGRQIREYRVEPGGGVQCTVSPEDDVVLARLAADLRAVSRLDLVIRVGDAPEQRLEDLPFEPNAEELVFSPSIEVLRALPAHVQEIRLLAVGPEGERVLGDYRFDHSPWPGT